MSKLDDFAVVALLHDDASYGLLRGQVGTVVELLSPSLAIIEFADQAGRTYALPTLSSDQLMRLYYQPIAQAA